MGNDDNSDSDGGRIKFRKVSKAYQPSSMETTGVCLTKGGIAVRASTDSATRDPNSPAAPTSQEFVLSFNVPSPLGLDGTFHATPWINQNGVQISALANIPLQIWFHVEPGTDNVVLVFKTSPSAQDAGKKFYSGRVYWEKWKPGPNNNAKLEDLEKILMEDKDATGKPIAWMPMAA